MTISSSILFYWSRKSPAHISGNSIITCLTQRIFYDLLEVFETFGSSTSNRVRWVTWWQLSFHLDQVIFYKLNSNFPTNQGGKGGSFSSFKKTWVRHLWKNIKITGRMLFFFLFFSPGSYKGKKTQMKKQVQKAHKGDRLPISRLGSIW